MIEYLGDSRIDGYPLVRISKNSEVDEFLNYFRNLKNDFGGQVDIDLVRQLEDHELYKNDFIVKILILPSYFKGEFHRYVRLLKLEKIEQLNEI